MIRSAINWILQEKDSPIYTWLKRLLALGFLVLIIYDGNHFIQNISLGQTFHLLHTIPAPTIAGYCALALLAVSFITLYDFAYFTANGIKLPKRSIFRTAWIASAINNVAGMGGLGGAWVRTVQYRKQNVSEAELLRMNMYLVPAFATGLGILMWFNLFFMKTMSAYLNQYRWIYALIALFLAYPLLYIASGLFKTPVFDTPDRGGDTYHGFRTKTILTGISALDWLAASTLLWFIGSGFHPGFQMQQSIFLFAVSCAAGILSLLPGGIGSFDLMLIVGLQTLGFHATEATATLLLFRFFFYFVPFLLGTLLGSAEIIPETGKHLAPVSSSITDFMERLSRWSVIPLRSNMAQDIAAICLSALVSLSGMILILSAAMPGLSSRIHFMAQIFSLPVLQFSHRISLLCGFILLLLSYEIRQKLKRAFPFTVAVLVIGTVFTLIKGLDYEESILLLMILSMLLISRKSFYRYSTPISWGTFGGHLIITTAFALLYVSSNQPFHFTFYNTGRAINFLFFHPSDYQINGMILLILSWGLTAAWLFCRPNARPWNRYPGDTELEKVAEFLKTAEGNALTHLMFCRDKHLYWAQNEQILIPFRQAADKWVVMGDPLGPSDKIPAAIEEFMDAADQYGYRAVFYQTDQKLLPLYHELGYSFFKLGEEAVVHLEHYDIGHPENKGFRNTRNRIEREGFVFEVIQPPYDERVLDQLEAISKVWLGKRHEKGFSMGQFNRAYLNYAPVALLKNSAGMPVAFASLMPVYNRGRTISVDLMRFSAEAPPGAMDYLFHQLFQWSKDRGYAEFNLGMAPLSNVGHSVHAHRDEQMARLVFRYGSYFYHFKGLRNYKDKFHPEWVPKYLAYPNTLSAPKVLLEVAMMVSHKKMIEEHINA